jgi:hypothetical protein
MATHIKKNWRGETMEELESDLIKNYIRYHFIHPNNGTNGSIIVELIQDIPLRHKELIHEDIDKQLKKYPSYKTSVDFSKLRRTRFDFIMDILYKCSRGTLPKHRESTESESLMEIIDLIDFPPPEPYITGKLNITIQAFSKN